MKRSAVSVEKIHWRPYAYTEVICTMGSPDAYTYVEAATSQLPRKWAGLLPQT